MKNSPNSSSHKWFIDLSVLVPESIALLFAQVKTGMNIAIQDISWRKYHDNIGEDIWFGLVSSLSKDLENYFLNLPDDKILWNFPEFAHAPNIIRFTVLSRRPFLDNMIKNNKPYFKLVWIPAFEVASDVHINQYYTLEFNYKKYLQNHLRNSELQNMFWVNI